MYWKKPRTEFFTLSKTITSNEILNMFTTPIVLVPSPGVGKLIVPIAANIKFTPGSVLYAAGGNVIFTYSSILSAVYSSINGVYLKTVNSATHLRSSLIVDLFSVDLTNDSLNFTNLSAAFTTGDGTIKIDLSYTIL